MSLIRYAGDTRASPHFSRPFPVSESAYEILNRKIEQVTQEKEIEPPARQQSSGRPSKEKSVMGEIMGSTVTRQIGRTVAREVTRGLLWILGIGGTRRKKSLF